MTILAPITHATGNRTWNRRAPLRNRLRPPQCPGLDSREPQQNRVVGDVNDAYAPGEHTCENESAGEQQHPQQRHAAVDKHTRERRRRSCEARRVRVKQSLEAGRQDGPLASGNVAHSGWCLEHVMT